MSREHRTVLAPERPIDRSEITQDAEPDLPEAPVEIPVRVVAPVRTQDVGVDMAASGNLNLTTRAEMVLPAQDSRAYAILISATEDFYVGPVKAAVAAGMAGLWPAGVPFRTNSRRALYAKTTSGTSVFSAFNYQVG